MANSKNIKVSPVSSKMPTVGAGRGYKSPFANAVVQRPKSGRSGARGRSR